MEEEIKFQLLCPLPLFDHVRPLLVVTHRHSPIDITGHTFYSLSEKSPYDTIVPELQNKLVRDGGCGDGWMLLEGSYDCSYFHNRHHHMEKVGLRYVCLLNILTMEKVQLPKLLNEVGRSRESRRWTFFIFSQPASSYAARPRTRLILYDCIAKDVMSCGLGDKSFTNHGCVALSGGVSSNFTKVGGKIYSLLGEDSFTLVVCDDAFNEPSSFRKVGMQEDVDLLGPWRCFLVESGGQLLLVQAGVKSYDASCLETLNFRIYLADFIKMKWVEIIDLGKRAIFLQARRGFCCPTSELQGVEENCIYFLFDCDRSSNMTQRKQDRYVYVFDLKDQSISSFLPCPDVQDWGQVLQWMMLSTSSID